MNDGGIAYGPPALGSHSLAFADFANGLRAERGHEFAAMPYSPASMSGAFGNSSPEVAIGDSMDRSAAALVFLTLSASGLALGDEERVREREAEQKQLKTV
jgi:hypothetical protein